MLFGRRSLTYGIVGGLVLGTVLFGDPHIAVRRAVNKYHYHFTMETPETDAAEQLYVLKVS